MTLKTQTEPKTTGSLDIAGRILRWNFFQYNVTESGNLCRLTALYNAAHKVPFAIKGHACALRPGTFAYMQAAPPEAPPQKPPFRSQVAQVKTCKAAPTRRRTLSAVRFERISRCFGSVWPRGMWCLHARSHGGESSHASWTGCNVCGTTFALSGFVNLALLMCVCA